MRWWTLFEKLGTIVLTVGGLMVAGVLTYLAANSGWHWANSGYFLIGVVLVGTGFLLAAAGVVGQFLASRRHNDGHAFTLPQDVASVTVSMTFGNAPVGTVPSGKVPQEGELPLATPDDMKATVIRGREMRLVDVATGDLLRGKRFEGCLIRGPAILFAMQDVGYESTVFDYYREIESILWAWPASSGAAGIIGVQQCTFSSCRFVGVGFTGPAELLDRMRRSFEAEATGEAAP